MIGVKFRKISSNVQDGVHLVFNEQKIKKINIGRAPGNHIILPGKSVSREHACIEVKGNAVSIRDLNSVNGILKRETIELKKVLKAKLDSGDRLAIGEYLLDIEIDIQIDRDNSDLMEPTTLLGLPQIHQTAAAMFDAHVPNFINEPKTTLIRYPSTAEVRKLLNKILATDSLLEAFMLDHFGDIYKRISAGMDRVAKINLLLARDDELYRLNIVHKLAESYREEFQNYKRLLEREQQLH